MSPPLPTGVGTSSGIPLDGKVVRRNLGLGGMLTIGRVFGFLGVEGGTIGAVGNETGKENEARSTETAS